MVRVLIFAFYYFIALIITLIGQLVKYFLTKFAFANFVLYLGSLRAFALKNLTRVTVPVLSTLPLDPTTFEKVDKTFNCHSYTMRKSFQPLRWKTFKAHFTRIFENNRLVFVIVPVNFIYQLVYIFKTFLYLFIS